MPQKIEISHRTIVFSVLFLVFLWFLYFIRDIILQFFVALLVMAVLDPLVTKLSTFRIPRGLSIAITYLVVFGIFGVALYSLVPPLIDQTASFAANLPAYFDAIPNIYNVNQEVIGQLLSQVGSLPSQVLRVSFSILSNIVNIIAVLIFAFYLLLARNKFGEQLQTFFGEARSREIVSTLDTLEKRLGGWARGQITLMVLVGILTYIGLTILGIPYSLPLAILAGILEMVPYLGPVIAAVPAVLIGFGISPLMGFGVMALALLIQQLENYVFVPKVMERSVGVSPVIVLLCLAIGFRLAGIVGAVIAIPVFITIQVFLQKYLLKK